MPVRPAVWGDLVPASRGLGRAFAGEHIFAQFMHPHRVKYPNDFYLFFLHRLREAYVEGPDSRLIVAYRKDETGQEIIGGIAYWQRKRTTVMKSWYYMALRKAVDWYNYLESFVFPNRALEPFKATALERAYPFIKHFWTGTRAEVWYLDLVGVDPSEEGKGFGKALVQYGFDKARAEGVGCSVIASDGKDGFYQKMGFDVQAARCPEVGGDQNPLNGIPGGTIHFWDNGRDISDVQESCYS